MLINICTICGDVIEKNKEYVSNDGTVCCKDCFDSQNEEAGKIITINVKRSKYILDAGETVSN